MTNNQADENGFSAVESILVLVIVAAIGLLGWYVYHVRQNTNGLYNATNSTSPNFGSKKAIATGDTSNSALVSTLQDATASANKGNQDMSTANGSLNDKSTLTTVPQ
jgi:predicted negative regulator of RcsB-dependent stress response